VELHGGTIWVESPGRGSRFTFSLPIPKGAEALKADDSFDESMSRRRSEQPVEG